MAGSQPLAPAKINGVDVQFTLDSGAFFSTLSAAKASEMNLRLEDPPAGMFFVGIGGFSSQNLTRVKSFDVAGSTISNIQFLVSEIGGSNSAVFASQSAG